MDRFEFIASVHSACMTDNLKAAMDAIFRLSPQEKSMLIQELLSGSAHQVILGGGNFITAEVVIQIQSSEVDLSEVLQAVSYRISKEKLDN